MSILNKLTEGIVNRDMKREGAALLDKWERTGLLEGLDGDTKKNCMARLLENQAKELLREAATSMSGGDVEGFAAVAFPIVRRVFGSLIANDLVSVQPMSLPSGLIFFLDFTFGGTKSNSGNRLGFDVGESLYGGDKVASQITGGVDLVGGQGTDAGQAYNLVNGYTSPTGTITFATSSGTSNGNCIVPYSGNYGDGRAGTVNNGVDSTLLNEVNRILRFDQDIVSGSQFAIAQIDLNATDIVEPDGQFNFDNLVAIALTASSWDAGNGDGASILVRRLSQLSQSTDLSTTSDTVAHIVFVSTGSAARTVGQQIPGTAGALNRHPGNTGADAVARSLNAGGSGLVAQCAIADEFSNSAGALGAVVGDPSWGLENQEEIPEINLKVDSVAVTAMTKKLKAKWTPELGQDLNAYHNLDAEVELTSILSEQVALEIDREILEDLVKGSTAGKYYWSRSPGLFVNKKTGTEVGASTAAPDFTGTVSEWYETLLETINDLSAVIHRKTLRGGANFVVTSPEVASIMEMTSGFRANVTVDDAKGTAGAQNVGSVNKRLDVFVDPYFPRNLLLVGRKGKSFLESGYVYAPYVPLQVTPTIFGTEDFVPRKGVMTRYAKKMVRPDMYGLVIVRGLLGESGS